MAMQVGLLPGAAGAGGPANGRLYKLQNLALELNGERAFALLLF
jgi:hypothetical protein